MYVQGEVLIYMYVCNVNWQLTSSDQYKKTLKKTSTGIGLSQYYLCMI